ncbi:WhiB family transcriptional regulator [Streptomyces chryseus]|uniref:WhiB family transcriptional regulator n=1 Tax=Streptomyces chryseus TaxID=68186 RepID=UPI00110F9D0B|nr:WhiB family transcriptional regulator [Streptomyces chryseus]GGW99566.1 transcriptional regulator WhiB [Streptomyces chryseus]
MPRPTHYGPHRFPDTIARPAHWDRRAACRNEDPRIFFPEGTEADVIATTALAKEICHRCPVSGNCQIDALERREPFGVWGGLDEHERRDILHRAAEQAALRFKEEAAAKEAADASAPAPAAA